MVVRVGSTGIGSPVRAIGCRGYGLLQAGEAVDEVVNAGQGQDAVEFYTRKKMVISRW